MLKAMIEKIADMAYDHTFRTPNGDTYYDNGKEYRLIEKAQMRERSHLDLCSLDALIKVIKREIREKHYRGPVYVSVVSPTCVESYTAPCLEANEWSRHALYTAKAVDVPGFNNVRYEYEEAIIALRSRFQSTADQQYVLQLMGNLVEEQAVETSDDGITQQVQTRKGIALKGVETVKPIVQLKPYRTFQEVDQPESDFLIRLGDNRSLTITEADGGMWKLQARKIVAEYLSGELAEEIEAGDVIVML